MTDLKKKKRTPRQRQMQVLAGLIRNAMMKNRRMFLNPYPITFNDTSWALIRSALNKASKP